MINAQITDRNALAARSPSELAMYLRAHNWVIRDRTDTGALWLKVVDGDEFEALQPLESNLRDYGSRVLDVLRVLAVVEERSELEILQDITNASMDVYLVRTFPTDSAPGLIGLDDGVQAFESLRGLIVAAAYSVSAEQPRAVQPARKPTEVLRFLREVRIGPSSEGSFILSAHTPIPPRLTSGQQPLFDADDASILEPTEPFERRVSLRIYDAAFAANSAAKDALVSPNGLDSFTESVRLGVSANLCEALVGLGGESGHPFDLSLSLASARPLARRTLLPIHFRRDHIPVLAAAAQELRERIAEEGILVVGNVVRLHRENTGSGEISVAGTIDGEDRLRRIWMNLAPSDYEQAMRAHQEMRSVSVRGDLVRRGTRLYMRNPSAFQVNQVGEED
ncbi:hypothetical protein ABZ436_27105 [Micromonospora matsumotoense]|uniref:hypothetical protein n=1 Tax=Micromonospora matsumotoense TaxID=121616 RepID=UPI0033E42B02